MEAARDLDQRGPSSFIRLEMAASWSHIATCEIGKQIPYTFPIIKNNVSCTITPRPHELDETLKNYVRFECNRGALA